MASALSWAASCLSFSVISLGSVKLSDDSAGDGMTEVGGVEERDGDGDGEELMLTINEHLITRLLALIYSVQALPQPVRLNANTGNTYSNLPYQRRTVEQTT